MAIPSTSSSAYGESDSDRLVSREQEFLNLAVGRSVEQPARRRLADVEREHIVQTLRAASGNKAAAASMLGLDRKTLYRKLTLHRIAAR